MTRHPTAEWLAQQIVEALPWETAPSYLVRDNDGAYGPIFRRRVRAMGIRDRPISPRSPWQNPYAERLIGTLRRDCLDHVLIFGARHLRRVLAAYSANYNETRTHLSLDKDAPSPPEDDMLPTAIRRGFASSQTTRSTSPMKAVATRSTLSAGYAGSRARCDVRACAEEVNMIGRFVRAVERLRVIR